jgi:hypothetical protein
MHEVYSILDKLMLEIFIGERVGREAVKGSFPFFLFIRS